jgi:predicted ATPase/DNA-binding NarL/FixJ family response regulator
VRVLIADDREIERLALQRAVEELGHKCLVASNGLEAWEMFQARGADVVISDWLMPGLDGPELCRRVRAHEAATYTYVILLTVLDEKQHRLAGIHAGADDYLIKPLVIDALEARLVAAARLTTRHREISQREAERERTIARREALLHVARRFAAAGDAERLLTDLLAEAVVLLGGTAGTVSQWDEVGGTLVPVRNTIPVEAGSMPNGSIERASGRAVERRTTVILNDYENSGEAGTETHVNGSGIEAAIAAPLVHEDRRAVLGAISVVTHRPEKHFTADDAEVLEQLARIGAAALVGLDRARLEGALLAMRTMDHLRPSNNAGGASGGSRRERDRRPNNLPTQPTSLIGREHDVETIRKELLRSATHVLTLTGPAGTGKTRLALAVAERLLEAFEDGVYFVDLEPVSDPALVTLAIAQALDIHHAGDRPLSEQLRQQLASKHVLLVLDNFEHVLAAGPQVGELLAQCPSSKALVTSRAHLGLRGERQYPVPPLALPDAARVLELQSVARSPVVALFVHRARASDPTFTLTDANARSVAELCWRLGGLPLAIELAAARSHVLPPQTMARLDRSLPFLTGGARDQPERHKTLAAAIAWSYALLAADQQRLFQQLAVFAGGFTLEAAAAVAEPADCEQTEILDEVGELLAKNLLYKEISPNAEPRFRLLETVREYALEQLVASGGRERIRSRHATFFLGLAERAESESRGTQQLGWLERLKWEHDNLQAALRWSVESVETEIQLALSAALTWFWEARGDLSEGCEWLEGALLRGKDAPGLARARAADAAGRLAHARGELTAARAYFEQSLDDHRRAGNKPGMTASLASWGLVRHRQGERSTARAPVLESLALARELGDRWGAANALSVLGEMAVDHGDLAAAQSLYRDSLDIWQELGDQWRLATALEGVARLAAARGEREPALQLAGAAAALRERIGTPLAPAARSLLERGLERARLALGEAASAAWAEGLAMPLQRALTIATAVEKLAPTPAPPSGAPGITGERGWLTRRERDIALLVARGLTNRQISAEVVLSERTVEAHVRNILQKLSLPSRTHLAVWVIEQRLSAEPEA